MGRPVTIVHYDPRWPLLYEEEKRRILQVIGHKIVGIEHIGSTAVVGLGAEPIIDIMVAVSDLDEAKQCIEPLQNVGYEYVPEYEQEVPKRRYFRKGHPRKEQHYHLHMVELTSDFWKKHLLFRDYLRTHPNVARQYCKLKEKLAAKYGSNHEGYTDGKTPFIKSVLAKASVNG